MREQSDGPENPGSIDQVLVQFLRFPGGESRRPNTVWIVCHIATSIEKCDQSRAHPARGLRQLAMSGGCTHAPLSLSFYDICNPILTTVIVNKI